MTPMPSTILELLGTPQLTIDEVWIFVPDQWIPVFKGNNSLLTVLQREFDLPIGTPDTQSLDRLLSQLSAEGHIELGTQVIDSVNYTTLPAKAKTRRNRLKLPFI